MPHRATPHRLHPVAAGAERHRRLRGHAPRRAGRALRMRSGLRGLAGGSAARRRGGRPGALAHRRTAGGRVLHQLGNNPGHGFVLQALRRVPGVTTLHDPGLLHLRQATGATQADLRAGLRDVPRAFAALRAPGRRARRGGAVPTTSSSTWRAKPWRVRAPWSFIPGSLGTGCAPCTARPRRLMSRSSRTSCPRSPCPRAEKRGRGSASRRTPSWSAPLASPQPRSASTGCSARWTSRSRRAWHSAGSTPARNDRRSSRSPLPSPSGPRSATARGSPAISRKRRSPTTWSRPTRC